MQIQYSVVARPSGVETKLNADAELQTSTVEQYQKFPHSNALMAKSCAQSLSLKCVTDKKNIEIFRPPAGHKVRAALSLVR